MEEKVSSKEGEEFAQEIGAYFKLTSAATNVGIMELFKELGLALPFIYDLNNLLKSYELINEEHTIEKELVDLLWK